MNNIIENVKKIIVGNDELIIYTVIALMCSGHILIEGVPGLGKTTLALSLAKSIDLSFKRIQFNPDTLPSDVTGFYMLNQKTSEFEYKEGGLFANFILADEINRTTPKAQSSLLEAMEENQITVDGITHKLPEPFMIIATQNPIEHIGTFPLPESQLDRFFMRLILDYPSFDDEVDLLNREIHHSNKNKIKNLLPVADIEQILYVKKNIEKVYVDISQKKYIITLINKTRNNRNILLGCSPRVSISLMIASKAVAALEGRDFVIPDDIKSVIYPVINHRILLTQEAQINNTSVKDIVEKIINSTKVPKV